MPKSTRPRKLTREKAPLKARGTEKARRRQAQVDLREAIRSLRHEVRTTPPR